MAFPLQSPVLPMLAKPVDTIPGDGEWSFEPKWDGFRAVIFRDHDELFIQSRDTKPLDRYFPELRAPRWRSFRSSAYSMARSSSLARRGSTSMRCNCACILRPRA